ncbi:MAG: hypothetical protein VB138_02100 [Burkholderia sp.]
MVKAKEIVAGAAVLAILGFGAANFADLGNDPKPDRSSAPELASKAESNLSEKEAAAALVQYVAALKDRIGKMDADDRRLKANIRQAIQRRDLAQYRSEAAALLAAAKQAQADISGIQHPINLEDAHWEQFEAVGNAAGDIAMELTSLDADFAVNADTRMDARNAAAADTRAVENARKVFRAKVADAYKKLNVEGRAN